MIAKSSRPASAAALTGRTRGEAAMRSTTRLTAAAAAAAALVLLLGCDFKTNEHGLVAAPDALADFALLDVNETSPSAGVHVSPRDYLGQVSAWYFGHST
jgi:hypothetical protein